MKYPHPGSQAAEDIHVFCARENELREIAAFINNNQSVSLVGPEKIGKTSLMRHVMKSEIAAMSGIAGNTLFVYEDCRWLVDKSLPQILTHFCGEITASMVRQGFDPIQEFTDPVEVPNWLAFEIAMRRLYRQGLRVVLMLDDFEHVTNNPRLDDGFYNALRSAAGRLRLVYLIISSQPLIDLTYRKNSREIISSPFFNIFAQVHLGLLSVVQAHCLIRNQLQPSLSGADAQLEDFIYDLVGGHPYAIQIACSSASEFSGDWSVLKQRIEQALEQYYQNVWEGLSAPERGILGDTAVGGPCDSEDPSIRVILRDLTRKCLLVHEDKGFRFPSKAWADFVTGRAAH